MNKYMKMTSYRQIYISINYFHYLYIKNLKYNTLIMVNCASSL